MPQPNLAARRPGGPPSGPGPRPQPGATAAVPTIDPVKVALKYKWWIVASVILGIATGVGLNTTFARLSPTFQVAFSFRASGIETDIGELNTPVSADELLRFMNTQVARIMSPQLLERVARSPRIQSEAPNWAAQFMTDGVYDYTAARRHLEDAVRARIFEGTEVFGVTVRGGNRQDPYIVATVIQDVYLEQVSDESRSGIRERSDQIRADLQQKESELERQTDRKKGIIRSESLESFQAQNDQAALLLRTVNGDLNQLQSDITATTERLERMEGQQSPDQARRFDDEQQAQADADPDVRRLRTQLSELERQQQVLVERGISRSHRSWRALATEIDATRRELDTSRGIALDRIFAATVDGTRNLLSGLNAQADDLRERRDELTIELAKLNETLTEVGEVEDRIARLREQRGRLQSQLETLEQVVSFGRSARVELFQSALPPEVRAFPKLIPMVAIGLISICGLTGLVIVARELLDQRVKGPSDVALIPRTRVIGLVPYSSEDPDNPKRIETIFRDAPQSVMAESFRQIRTAVLKHMDTSGHTSLMIVPGMPGSGASSLTLNLGIACAAAERRVLLIDANFRRASLHRPLGLDEAPGLADVLSEDADLETVAQPTGTTGLDMVSAGTRSKRVVEHLGSSMMSRLLQDARGRYDLVLLDVAPAVVSGDGSALAGVCDASILVVRAMAEKRGLVARVRNELADGRAELLGVIVNAVRASAGGYMKRNIRATFEYQKPDKAERDARNAADAASDDTTDKPEAA